MRGSEPGAAWASPEADPMLAPWISGCEMGISASPSDRAHSFLQRSPADAGKRLAVWLSKGVEEGNQNHTLPTLTCLIFRETNGTIPQP